MGHKDMTRKCVMDMTRKCVMAKYRIAQNFGGRNFGRVWTMYIQEICGENFGGWQRQSPFNIWAHKTSQRLEIKTLANQQRTTKSASFLLPKFCAIRYIHAMLFTCACTRILHSNIILRWQKCQMAKMKSWKWLENWKNLMFHSANTNDLCDYRKFNCQTKQHFVVTNSYCYNFQVGWCET